MRFGEDEVWERSRISGMVGKPPVWRGGTPMGGGVLDEVWMRSGYPRNPGFRVEIKDLGGFGVEIEGFQDGWIPPNTVSFWYARARFSGGCRHCIQ